MPNQHSLLSPSSSERWLNCPRSARVCEKLADPGSPYASEGTEAHALCEHLLLTALGRDSTDPRPLFKQYSQEMQDAAEGYVQYVTEQVVDFRAKGIDPVVYVEQRLDLRAFTVVNGNAYNNLKPGTAACHRQRDDLCLKRVRRADVQMILQVHTHLLSRRAHHDKNGSGPSPCRFCHGAGFLPVR